MKKATLITLSSLATLMVMVLGIYIYGEFLIRKCDNQLKSAEYSLIIEGNPNEEDVLKSLYNESKNIFTNLDIKYTTGEDILKDYRLRNADDLNIISALNILEENPFGPTIKFSLSIREIDTINDLNVFINKKLSEMPYSQLYYSANLSELEKRTPQYIKSQLKKDGSILNWRIEYLHFCKKN